MNRRNLLITAVLTAILVFTSSNLFPSAAARPTVGLVLGGGAARGFSHIGLIKALEEHGVPIDLLVGTSMGSIVASLYAAGYSVDNMAMLIENLELGSLVNLSIPPHGGVVDTSRLECYLNVLLDGQDLTSLGIPFYPVITELRTGEEVVLKEGAASRGVLASMSIPGLFLPVEIDGKYYVDGGMKNAVPANVAQDMGAQVIIAVDVKKDLPEVDYNSILNNIQLTMWFMIDGYVQLQTEAADVVIVPDVKFDSYMDYQRADYFIAQGYNSGLAYMEAIKQAILAADPSFEFVPYAQPGFSAAEIEEIIAKARQAAVRVKPQFTVKPQLKLERPYGLGLEMGGGPLGWWGGGYTYWFGEAPGHEGYISLSRPELGQLSLGVRTSSAWDGPSLVLRAQSAPFWKNTYLTAAYQGKGREWWNVSLYNPSLFGGNFAELGLKTTVGQRRLPEKEAFVAWEPTVRLYPTTDFIPVLELALLRPYFFAGLDVEHTLSSPTTVTVQGGVGSKVRLFGLYPFDVQMGLERTSSQAIQFRFAVIGGHF